MIKGRLYAVLILFGEGQTKAFIFMNHNNEEYGVVHRVAVDNHFKGVGLFSTIFQRVEEVCIQKGVHSIRIDTHEDNKAMKQAIVRSKLIYCGIIYLEDGSKRIAFEKVINT